MKNKTYIKAKLSIMVLFLYINAIAQITSDTINEYRVTAYQKGNSEIMSISNIFEIVPAAVLYIPNAFTPNSDGLNDTFGAVGEGIIEYNMQIFDRWGNLIFESNDMKVQWDGTYHNELVPNGVYVYKIDAKGPAINGNFKKLIHKNGNVTVVI